MSKIRRAKMLEYNFQDGEEVVASVKIECGGRIVSSRGNGKNRSEAMKNALLKAALELEIPYQDFVRISLRFCPTACEILRELRFFPYYFGF